MMRGDRVLITGATSGLGREMARQLGQRGCRVAITGRRDAKLREAERAIVEAGGEALALLGSVSDRATVEAHYGEIRSRWGGLDVAILNAGVADSRPAQTFTADDYRWTFETNVFGVCEWVEAVLPDMLASKRGVIAGISSPAAWRGFPATGSYCASKAALSTMLESMRLDLRGTGVDVITVCPGWVRSEITDRNDPGEMFILLEVEDGARRILRGIDRRRRLVHFPWQMTWLVRYLIRPLPMWVYDPLIARFVKRNKQPYVDESAVNTDGDRPA